jgi:hypothetical protein
MSAFHICDDGYGGNCVFAVETSFEAALATANDAIAEYRHQCDPEWSDCVESIAIYEAPPGTEDPQEDGNLVAKCVMFDVDERPNDVDEDGYSPSTDKYWDRVDFYCDYRMEPLP